MKQMRTDKNKFVFIYTSSFSFVLWNQQKLENIIIFIWKKKNKFEFISECLMNVSQLLFGAKCLLQICGMVFSKLKQNKTKLRKQMCGWE